ncbi:MAG: ATP-dependent helicase, partial [Cryobacterium sp.]
YGLVTRGPVMAENVTGGFALVYRTLSGFEEMGRCRRGYFVEGLGAAQFATGGTIDRLRSLVEVSTGRADAAPVAVTLAATDPANPYGAMLPWPELPAGTTHRPGRKAGAVVVLVDGALALYLERGGKTVLVWGEDAAAPYRTGADRSGFAGTAAAAGLARAPRGIAPDARQIAAAGGLAALVRDRRVSKIAVETVNGVFVIGTVFGQALRGAGFTETPKGLRV